MKKQKRSKVGGCSSPATQESKMKSVQKQLERIAREKTEGEGGNEKQDPSPRQRSK